MAVERSVGMMSLEEVTVTRAVFRRRFMPRPEVEDSAEE